MAFIAAPFDASGNYPIDRRFVFDTISAMTAYGADENSRKDLPDAYFAVVKDQPGKIYVYNKDTTTSGGWTEVGGDCQVGKLSKDIFVTTTWGYLKAGTTLASGTNIEDVLTSALNSYVKPTVTASVNKSIYEYPSAGEPAATVNTMTISAKLGSNPVTSIAFVDSTSTSSVSWSGINVAKTATSAINKAVTGDTTLSAWVSDSTSSYAGTVIIKFALPYFYGVSDTSAIDDVTTGTKITPTSTSQISQNDLKFECGDGKYMWFAYNSSFKNLTAIKQGVTEISEQFTTASANYNDKKMKVYVTTGLNIDDNILSFNF